MSAAKIISLGSINLDFQLRGDRWPAQGETLHGKDFLVDGGGKAANRSYIAHKLGGNAQLIGRVGDDAFAELALGRLREAGVASRASARRVAALPGSPSSWSSPGERRGSSSPPMRTTIGVKRTSMLWPPCCRRRPPARCSAWTWRSRSR